MKLCLGFVQFLKDDPVVNHPGFKGFFRGSSFQPFPAAPRRAMWQQMGGAET